MKDALEFHSSIASQWKQKYSHKSFDHRLRTFEALISSKPVSGQWLDAGCGAGNIGSICEFLGADVTFMDASEEMLSACKKDHANCILGSVDDAPLPSASFDGIICSSVVEYLKSPDAAMSEFSRLLKPSGRLVISAPHSYSPIRLAMRLTSAFTGKPKWIKFSINSFTERSFADFLKRSGFQPDRISRTGVAGSLIVASCIKTG